MTDEKALTSNERLHSLRCWPEFYAKLESGEKTFELRKDDRGFRAGDMLLLREWLPGTEVYTGRETLRRVTYLMCGPAFGLLPGYVCMALSDDSCTHETTPDDLARLYDVFHIGNKVRNFATLLANVENAARRSDCLSAIEREFTRTVKDEDGEDTEECPLSWGADAEEYIEQFRAALASRGLTQETTPDAARETLKRIRDRTRMSSLDFESSASAVTFAYHEALKIVGGEPSAAEGTPDLRSIPSIALTPAQKEEQRQQFKDAEKASVGARHFTEAEGHCWCGITHVEKGSQVPL